MIARFRKPLFSGVTASLVVAAGVLSHPERWNAPSHPLPAPARLSPEAAPAVHALPSPDPARWAALDAVVRKALQEGPAPGMVLLVEHRGQVVYRKAAGYRNVIGVREPMTVDTVFDLASLTKAVATTTAVMALVQEGRLSLEDRVVDYWPEFAAGGKEAVTLRQLLTHTSGLPGWIDFQKQFADPSGPQVQDHLAEVLAAIAALPLRQAPDRKEVYSDLGFITLGEVVRRVTGQSLDRFTEQQIFQPLGMWDTTFNPAVSLVPRIAPTTLRHGRLLRGKVHDPNAAICGGVAGHAGLFSTADDLARFARMLLAAPAGKSPLRAETVRRMTAPAGSDGLPLRGLGWDIDSPYCPIRDSGMRLGTFGHVGFTGTFLWVDPYSQTFIIALTNRVHPRERGSMRAVWSALASTVARLTRDEPPTVTVATSGTPLRTGLDRLSAQGFQSLRGRKIGLISSAGAVSAEGFPAADLLCRTPGPHVARLFLPAHDLYFQRRQSTAKSRQRLPVQCICGAGDHQLGAAQLKGLDTLLFDAGLTGTPTDPSVLALRLAVRAAAAHHLRLVVLDRPVPSNSATPGELAGRLRGEMNATFPLEVVRMEGWHRTASVAAGSDALSRHRLYP